MEDTKDMEFDLGDELTSQDQMRAVIDVWPARKTCPGLYMCVQNYIVLTVKYYIVVYSSIYYFLYITGGKTCLHSSAACTVTAGQGAIGH